MSDTERDPLAELGDFGDDDAEARALLAEGVRPDVVAPLVCVQHTLGDRGPVPPATRPDLPLRDEHSMPVVYYDCWRCKRQQYMAEDAYEIYRVRNLRPFCLPCQNPDHFAWQLDDQGREYLHPKPPVIGRGLRPGEREAARLDLLAGERRDKMERRALVVDVLERMQVELAGLDSRLAELELELPEAQDAVVRAQTDPNRPDQLRAEDLLAQLAKEVSKLNVMQNNADRRKWAAK